MVDWIVDWTWIESLIELGLSLVWGRSLIEHRPAASYDRGWLEDHIATTERPRIADAANLTSLCHQSRPNVGFSPQQPAVVTQLPLVSSPTTRLPSTYRQQPRLNILSVYPSFRPLDVTLFVTHTRTFDGNSVSTIYHYRLSCTWLYYYFLYSLNRGLDYCTFV